MTYQGLDDILFILKVPSSILPSFMLKFDVIHFLFQPHHETRWSFGIHTQIFVFHARTCT